MSYIRMIPGEVKGPDDTISDVITLLGLTGINPIEVTNDGRQDPPIATLIVDGKQYPLKAVLAALKTKLNPLPTVKAADNGKVLTVVNGKWAAAELPAGE